MGQTTPFTRYICEASKSRREVFDIRNITELFHQYKDDVYRLALSYTRSREVAEDVCQTVFLKLMEQTKIEPGKEKAWLMRVTVNECNSLLRSCWWKRTVSLDEPTLGTLMHTNEVLDAVMTLEPKYRVVLYLHYYEGLTTKEISSLLHITQSGVTSRLSRAREMLKNKLKEDE